MYKHFKALPVDRNEDGSVIEGLVPPENEAVRCLKISPDGKTMASGDLDGNIRIYDLTQSDDIKLLKLIEAHDREVICLAYSPNLT